MKDRLYSQPEILVCIKKASSLTINNDGQGSRICGTFSDPELTPNHFLRTRMLRFSRQKCRILTFRDKNFTLF